MTTSAMILFCLVDGEANAFSVEIEPQKPLMPSKSSSRLRRHPNSTMSLLTDSLWRVSIPVPPKKGIWLADVPSKEELDETDDIADVFSEAPPKKTIHIIVQRPPPQ
ncbi:hypothetical protein BGW41_007032, partial [Actinomortierella wolfii]